MFGKNNLVEQPSEIKKGLYAHQLTSIYNMEMLEKEKSIELYNNRYIHTNIGILSDLTGYGKTLSILGLISRNKTWHDDKTVFTMVKRTGNDTVFQVDESYYEKVNCTLVVMNSIILSQWENELKYTTMSWRKVSSKKEAENLEISDIDIVLCDYQYYSIVCSIYSKVAFKRIVIDEPNTIKIQENRYISDFVWLITATPYELFIKKKYEHILTSDLNIFEKIIVKNDDEYVKKSFNMPPNTIITYKCMNVIYDIIKDNVRYNIRELACAENIPGLLESLGYKDKPESIVNIIYRKKVEKLKEIENMLNIKKDSLKLEDKKKIAEDEILKFVNSLETIISSTRCYLCSNNFKSPSFVTCCQNIMCSECISNHIEKIEKKCPICRDKIDMRNIVCINVNTTMPVCDKSKFLTKTKSQIIRDIIIKDLSKKYIIYSEFSESFDTLKRLLNEQEILYTELKGYKSQKERSLENYRNGSVNVLLLTTLQYSAGIDLMNTTDILLYHEMEESVKTQIIGRANRIGRVIPLVIHHMS
jgi:hypothetical protein